MANFEVAEIVNRSPVDRSGIGKHSIDIRAAIRRFQTIFGFKIRTEVGRTARPPHGVPTILERPPFVSCPTCTKSDVLRMHSVLGSSRRRADSTGSSRQLRNLSPTPWQLLGLRGNPCCYGLPGRLSCTSRNSHAHRRTQAGCWAEPARVSAERRPGVRRHWQTSAADWWKNTTQLFKIWRSW